MLERLKNLWQRKEIVFRISRLDDMIIDLLCGRDTWVVETIRGRVVLKFYRLNEAKLQQKVLDWLMVPERVKNRELCLKHGVGNVTELKELPRDDS